jgi:hypothetical protein
MPAGKSLDLIGQRTVFVRRLGLVTLGRAALTDNFAGPTFGNTKRMSNTCDRLPFPGRAQ